MRTILEIWQIPTFKKQELEVSTDSVELPTNFDCTLKEKH